MLVALYCLVSVFAWIPYGLLEGLVKTEVCVSPFLKNSVVSDSAPTVILQLAELPFFGFITRQRATLRSFDYMVTANRGDKSQFFRFSQSSIKENYTVVRSDPLFGGFLVGRFCSEFRGNSKPRHC